MSAPTATVSNFRGLRAFVAVPEDAGRKTLLAVLRNLGMVASMVDPLGADEPSYEGDLAAADLIIFDADVGQSPALVERLALAPSIAVIGMETPSRLARLTRLRVSTHLMKPLRSSGVFSAVFLATNEWAERQRLRRDHEAMAARVRDRRSVIRAVIQVMACRGCDDDEAFTLLRRESMRRRISVESLACKILAAPSEPEGVDEDIESLFRL
jgi:AmiR/NasT family two-component response regulator